MSETLLDSFSDKTTKKGNNNIQLTNVINININIIIKFFIFLKQSDNNFSKNMLGKKRNKDDYKRTPPPIYKTNQPSYSANKHISKHPEVKKPNQDLIHFYNMERYVSMNCVTIKHSKYPNNSYIPTLSFSHSSF